MKKEQLKTVRIVAIIFSCLVASLTICNLITVATHGINFELPKDENDVKIAYDPVNNNLLFITDFKVNNQGTYDINDIDIKVELYNEDGVKLVDFSNKDLVVPRGCNKKFDVIISLDLDKISILEWLSLIYKDTYFRLLVDVDVAYMFNLIDVTVDEEIIFPLVSPLTSFVENNTMIKTLFSLIESTVNESSIDTVKELESVKKILNTSYYENTYKDIYKIEVNIFNISNFSKLISTKIETYLPKIDSTIDIEFDINIQYGDNEIFSKIEEVKVNLW